MNTGLSNKSLILLKDILLKYLKKYPQIKVWVFGSRATGKYKEFSDIDLLLDPDAGINSIQLGSLKAELEESDLPIEVDIVPLSELVPEFSEQIMKERKLFELS